MFVPKVASMGLAANQAVGTDSRQSFLLNWNILTAHTGVYLGGVGLHLSDIEEKYEDANAIQIALKVRLERSGTRIVQEAVTNIIVQTIVVATYLWPTATWFIKTSIMLMYIEIFEKKLFRVMSWVLVGVTSAFCLGLIIAQSALCRPFAKNWDKTLDGTCGDSVKTQFATAIFNLILDLSIAALPLPILWRLQMNFRKKVVVTFLLTLGLIICAINLARLIVTVLVDWLDFSYSLNISGHFCGARGHTGDSSRLCANTAADILTQARLGSNKQSSHGYSKSASNTSAFRDDKAGRIRPNQATPTQVRYDCHCETIRRSMKSLTGGVLATSTMRSSSLTTLARDRINLKCKAVRTRRQSEAREMLVLARMEL